MPRHDIVVVGGSLGGLEALQRLAAGLPEGLPAAVLVVLHTASSSPGALGEILDRAGPLPARLAEDGEPLAAGRIYVAPPNRHLLLTPDAVRLSDGPRENRTRPAADPLFRSAAVYFRARVVGVVLTGLLDDGAAGLRAVERCGGEAVVQDPDDALYADMPRNAQSAVPGALRAPVAEMGALIGRLVGEPAAEPPPVPRDLALEVRLAERSMPDLPKTDDPTAMDEMDVLDELGERLPLSCPDCSGAVWHLRGSEPPRYRCHIGHAYTQSALANAQADATEQALSVALRTLEERSRMLRRMAGDDGRAPLAEGFGERAAEFEGHAEQIRRVLAASRP